MWFVPSNINFIHEFPTNNLPAFSWTLNLIILREPLFLSNGPVGNKALLILNLEGKKIIMDLGDFNSRLKGNGL